MRKEHINYGVINGMIIGEEMHWKGYIQYFDGESIIQKTSEQLPGAEEAWQWIAERLKNDDF